MGGVASGFKVPLLQKMGCQTVQGRREVVQFGHDLSPVLPHRELLHVVRAIGIRDPNARADHVSGALFVLSAGNAGQKAVALKFTPARNIGDLGADHIGWRRNGGLTFKLNRMHRFQLLIIVGLT